MCANFKPLTLGQLKILQLPDIPFDYVEEVYPNYQLPLLFASKLGLEWRQVGFGMVPKWAEDKSIARSLNLSLVLFQFLSFTSLSILIISLSAGVYVEKTGRRFILLLSMKSASKVQRLYAHVR